MAEADNFDKATGGITPGVAKEILRRDGDSDTTPTTTTDPAALEESIRSDPLTQLHLLKRALEEAFPGRSKVESGVELRTAPGIRIGTAEFSQSNGTCILNYKPTTISPHNLGYTITMYADGTAYVGFELSSGAKEGYAITAETKSIGGNQNLILTIKKGVNLAEQLRKVPQS